MDIKEKLHEINPFKDLSDVKLTKESLELINDELDRQKHITYIKWNNGDETLLNNETLVKEIQKKLVDNLVKSMKGLVIDLSNIELKPKDHDLDYLSALANAVEVNDRIGAVYWGKKNEDALEGKCNTKTRIDRYLTIYNNEKFVEYPSDYIHCLLTYDCCKNTKDSYEKLTSLDWEIYKLDKKDQETFLSKFYVNHKTRQLVLAFRGLQINMNEMITDKNELSKAVQGVLCKEITVHSFNSYKCAQEATELSKQLGYSLSFTGYSFGAWLAEQCVWFAHREFDRSDTKAVTFESPGSFDIIENLAESNLPKNSLSKDILCKMLNVKTYLMAPNFVNTANRHIGSVYRIMETSPLQKQLEDLDKLVTDKIQSILKNDKIFNVVLKWYNAARDKFDNYKFYLNGLKTLFSNDLDWILNEFDPKTGGLKNPNKLFEVEEWPLIESTIKGIDLERVNLDVGGFVDKILPSIFPGQNLAVEWLGGKISNAMNAFFRTIAVKLLPNVLMILNLLIEIRKGNINADKCWNCYKYDEIISISLASPESSSKDDDKNNIKPIFDEEKFNLAYIDKYRIKLADLKSDKLRLSNSLVFSDWMIYDFYRGVGDLARSPIKNRFDSLKQWFKIEKENDRISSDLYEIERIRERFRRLLRINKQISEIIREAKSKEKFKINDFFGPPKLKTYVQIPENLFEKIDGYFEASDYVNIFGAPSSGKTTLATEYAYYIKS